MNKDAIYKTAVCFWDVESECFVVRSPIFQRVIGADETPEGAWKVFSEILDDTYTAYKAGKLAGYGKVGRPAKDKVRLNTELAPDIKRALETLSDGMQISQGEAIEYCVHFYQVFGARVATHDQSK